MYQKIVVLLILSFQLIYCALENEDLTNHMRKCCLHGLRHARKQDRCDNYEYEVKAIPPLWIGLCHSTYGVCCSRELENLHCLAGRMAAITGSDCNKQQQHLNATSAYADCCHWCHLGLAVKASDSDCHNALFDYFNEIESYRLCCTGHINNTNNNNKQLDDFYGLNNANNRHLDAETGAEIEAEVNTADGTIVLQDDDDDICSKVPNLCHQICENTLEAYRCKCHKGYNLNEDNVTCSLITSEDTDKKQQTITDPNAADRYLTDLDDDDEELEEDLEVSKEPSYKMEDDICPAGYIYDKITRKCADLDECAVKGLTVRCKDNQFCHNTIGSYHCLNKEQLNNSKDNCAHCEQGFVCMKQSGRYKCVEKCAEGYTLKNGECEDIDECILDDAACAGPNQTCINDQGGYHCECKVGFRFDVAENECVDINECSINNHDCLPTQRCDNTLGSYVCTRLQSCGTGYTLDADNGICVDNDECALSTHNCPLNYECHNTKGSFRCYRRVTTTSTTTTTTTTTTTAKPTTTTEANANTNYGYNAYWNRSQDHNYPGYSAQTYARNYARDNGPRYLTSDLRKPCDIGFQRNHLGACVDVNECLIYQPCGSHQRCINSNGSYRCLNLLDCGSGFKATPDATACEDINECETGEHNCADTQICQNRHGGFICSCPPGYHLKSIPPSGSETCVDINECEQERPSVCPQNAECLNTVGSYFCDCKTGFKKSRENERICVDVDECAEIPGLCQHKCNNFWGSYRCSCNTGYELSADNRTCADIDECEVLKNYKLCMGFCHNVPGSYECSCPRGYTMDDKVRCRDIDECATGDFCTGRNDICTNIHGSYRCTTIRCPYGYQNDANQKNRCILMHNYCEGEACYNKPSAYTHHFITLTANLSVPPEGRRIFLLQGPKFYDNIDFDLKLVRVQAAITIEKATENHFDMIKEDKHQITLRLRKPLEGPQDIELELSMTVFTQGLPRGKSVTKLQLIVSQYEF